MAEPIMPIMPGMPRPPVGVGEITSSRISSSGDPFADILQKAVDALSGVGETEATANKLVEGYLAGQVDLSEVMVAQARLGIAVQLAVTTITSAVTAFKEITQMAI